MDSIPPQEPGTRHMLATGHYARVVHDISGRSRLCRAVDHTKDQSYYLSQVTEPQLSRVSTPYPCPLRCLWLIDQSVFPLGGIRKEDVRRLAKYYNLPTADRAESMGVCFIGERGRFGDFICTFTASPLSYLAITIAIKSCGYYQGESTLMGW